MARKRVSFDVVVVIQIVLAVFLISLGVVGINDWNSNASQFSRGLTRFFGGTNNPFNLIVAICELAAGVIVFVGVFVSGQARLLFAATLVIAILWAVLIVVTFFTQDAFQPDLFSWLSRLSADLIVLLSLWLVNRKYA
ncbi:MAG TPA: hypothetical protein VFH83_01435 [Spirochaetia bacterium]|nr:hypothetical protein [Spirochaetia bacterium]